MELAPHYFRKIPRTKRSNIKVQHNKIDFCVVFLTTLFLLGNCPRGVVGILA